MKIRQKDLEPDVYVYLDRQDVNYYLVIENAGGKGAYDVVFEYSQDFLDFLRLAKEYKQDLQILLEGVAYLAPKQKVQIFLANKANINHVVSLSPQTRYLITSQYINKHKKKFTGDYLLDISEIRSLNKKKTEDPLVSIDHTLRQTNFELNLIAEKLEKISQKGTFEAKKIGDKLPNGLQKSLHNESQNNLQNELQTRMNSKIAEKNKAKIRSI